MRRRRRASCHAAAEKGLRKRAPVELELSMLNLFGFADHGSQGPGQGGYHKFPLRIGHYYKTMSIPLGLAK
jgi:hypothetical protein